MALPKLIYAIIGIKGGVGKSLISINVATILSKFMKVGLVDCDIDSSNIPGMMNVTQPMTLAKDGVRFRPIWITPTLKMVSLESIGMGRKKAAITKEGKQHQQIIRDLVESTVWGRTEVIIADMPAGSSDEFLGLISIFPELSGAIAVAQPTTGEDLYRVIDMCKYHGIRLMGVVENMKGTVACCGEAAVCPKCGSIYNPLPGNAIGQICDLTKVRYYGSIPLSDKIAVEKVIPKRFDMPIHRIVNDIRGCGL